MERPILDKIDFNILATLARDCRTSYSSMGSMVSLTSKSVKARVKNMVRCGVIEKFIVRVNPEGFGCRTARILVMTNKGVTKDDVILRTKQFGDLAYHVHHMGRTSIAALIIKKPLDNKTSRSLNDALKPATVSRITVSELPVSRDLSVSDTDLRIIRCLLLLGARVEISGIANELGISEKTTTRRLDRMKKGPNSPSFPFPNDLRRNPLNIKTIARAIATMALPRGTWNTNAITREIAAPTKLYGSHLLIATEYLSKFYIYHKD